MLLWEKFRCPSVYRHFWSWYKRSCCLGLANMGDCETDRKTEQDNLITKQVKVSPWIKQTVGVVMSKRLHGWWKKKLEMQARVRWWSIQLDLISSPVICTTETAFPWFSGDSRLMLVEIGIGAGKARLRLCVSFFPLSLLTLFIVRLRYVTMARQRRLALKHMAQRAFSFSFFQSCQRDCLYYLYDWNVFDFAAGSLPPYFAFGRRLGK